MTYKANMNILKLIEGREIGLLTTYLQAKSGAELVDAIDDLDSFLDDADKLRGIIVDIAAQKTAAKIKAMDYQS